MNERVLGFDARGTLLPTWLQERRHEYLLRTDVEQPLSADDRVWPSVFSDPPLAGGQQTGGVNRPDWIGSIHNLWEDLRRLTAWLNETCGAKWPDCRLIALTVVDEFCTEKERSDWAQRAGGVTPASVSNSWELLGYDIGDMWLLSGLSNCGYLPDREDVDAIRRRWAPHLNQHNLFDDVRQAHEFKMMSDERVDEHAPFFVYGLHAVPSDA